MKSVKTAYLIFIVLLFAALGVAGEQVLPFADGFRGPENLAFDGKGFLYVTDTNHLYKVAPNGKKEIIYTRAKADGRSLCGVRMGPKGKVYFSAGNRILAYKPGTGSVTEVARKFGLANGITFNDKGDLFVADSIKGRVYVVPAETNKKRTLKACAGWANGVAWDRKDNTLFYTTTYPGRLCALKLDDQLKVEKHFKIAKFKRGVPDDITLDADGNVILCGWGDGEVRRVTRDGKIEILVEGIDGPSAAAFGTGDRADTLFICVKGGSLKFKGTQLVTSKVGVTGYRLPFMP